WQKFSDIIGFQYLRGMHLNDTMKGHASRVDRHQSIGTGFLGENTFKMIMADSRFDGIPLVLETPDESLWPDEINKLKSWIHAQ
ncbi:MAG: deoxyribonuclease IV, partial [Bacteroidales bacterium]|nr:deoxyribonuclease IV [Bacteroidales bacterium]